MKEQFVNRIVDDLLSILAERIFPDASDSTDNGLQTLEEKQLRRTLFLIRGICAPDVLYPRNKIGLFEFTKTSNGHAGLPRRLGITKTNPFKLQKFTSNCKLFDQFLLAIATGFTKEGERSNAER